MGNMIFAVCNRLQWIQRPPPVDCAMHDQSLYFYLSTQTRYLLQHSRVSRLRNDLNCVKWDVTVCSTNVTALTFVHIFARHRPIFKLLSPAHSADNKQRKSQLRSHHTLNASLHNLVKHKCSKIALSEAQQRQTDRARMN